MNRFIISCLDEENDNLLKEIWAKIVCDFSDPFKPSYTVYAKYTTVSVTVYSSGLLKMFLKAYQ